METTPSQESTNSSPSYFEPPQQPQQNVSFNIAYKRYSPGDDQLIKHLKEEEMLSWKEIAKRFPGRSQGSIQVHYTTQRKSKETRQLREKLPKRARRQPNGRSISPWYAVSFQRKSHRIDWRGRR